MKKVYKYFGGFLDTQEKWLNEMAHHGYRLVAAGKLRYTFEECQPNEYQYAIEFIAQHGLKSAKSYRSFLEEVGYRVLTKNINLNFSIGKIKWRPYGSGTGQITTSPGTYNKELLIVEKKVDGSPFALHSTYSDQVAYYKPLKNAWLTNLVLILVLAIWQFVIIGSTDLLPVLGIGALLCLIPFFKYQKRIAFFQSQSNIQESQ